MQTMVKTFAIQGVNFMHDEYGSTINQELVEQELHAAIDYLADTEELSDLDYSTALSNMRIMAIAICKHFNVHYQ